MSVHVYYLLIGVYYLFIGVYFLFMSVHVYYLLIGVYYLFIGVYFLFMSVYFCSSKNLLSCKFCSNAKHYVSSILFLYYIPLLFMNQSKTGLMAIPLVLYVSSSPTYCLACLTQKGNVRYLSSRFASIVMVVVRIIQAFTF
jgi:hypothetical protein